MDRSQVNELFYIAHIDNITGILRSGILSHNRVARVSHAKVDLATVQEIRERKPVGDRMLHDHANLYVCGRNPMMYYVIHNNPIDEVCLLRVSPDVLDLPDVVVTDGNAARWETGFYAVDDGLAAIDFDRVHARYWTHAGEPVVEYEHKRVKQAEVLVPDWVDPAFIVGAIAPTRAAGDAVQAAAGALAVTVAGYPFFRGWS